MAKYDVSCWHSSGPNYVSNDRHNWVTVEAETEGEARIAAIKAIYDMHPDTNHVNPRKAQRLEGWADA